MNGRVTIAGAGPGELDHLTIAALRAIQNADVILYDALICPSIISEFSAQAEKVFVGKRCGDHAYTQTMLINLMVERALMGKHVVRLKGGDPSLFAHLASELDALRALEIQVTILPGVSAMLTAAATLQVPLTTREMNRHIWITDGHSGEIEKYTQQMAEFPGTLIFYMGASRTAEITSLLISWGMRSDKAAALVENAGSSEARIARGTIADFAEHRLLRKTSGPGIFLIGDTIQIETEKDQAGELYNHAFTP